MQNVNMLFEIYRPNPKNATIYTQYWCSQRATPLCLRRAEGLRHSLYAVLATVNVHDWHSGNLIKLEGQEILSYTSSRTWTIPFWFFFWGQHHMWRRCSICAAGISATGSHQHMYHCGCMVVAQIEDPWPDAVPVGTWTPTFLTLPSHSQWCTEYISPINNPSLIYRFPTCSLCWN